MRVAASRLSCSAAFMRLFPGPQAEQMADGVAELGAVQRVEMELPDAAGIKLPAQLRRYRRGDQLAGGRQVVQPLEQPVEPVRDIGAAHRSEPARLGDVGDRQ